MLNDLRHGLRVLRAAPGQTLVVLLALSLAIGANTAIFSVTQAVLLRPLPFAEADRLVALWETHPILGKQEIAAADYDNWKAETHTFEAFAAFTMPNHVELSLSGAGMEPEQVRGTLATDNLFAVLGIQPLLGRTFVANDNLPGHDRVAVIGHTLWQRRFGADAHAIGRSILLNGESFEIIGVLPARVQMPDWAEVWLPLSRMEPAARQARQWHSLQGIARLKPGVARAEADADLQLVVTRLQRDFPVSNKPTGGLIVPLREEYFGSVQTALILLTIAVGLVLFIACVNVAHLTLARAIDRRREMAVRAALGATRGRLARQLLAEQLVTGAIAGTVGVLLAALGMGALRGAASDILPRAQDVRLDPTTLLVAVALCAIAVIAAGLVPALQMSRAGLVEALKDGDRASSGARARRLHAALVAAEIALALVVLVSGGLLAASFRQLLAVEPGFATRNLLSARVSLVWSRWSSEQAVRQFYERLFANLGALPGVTEVATVDTPPLTRAGSRFAVRGLPEPAAGHFPVAQFRAVTPSYFATMGIPIVEGRGFDEHDIGSPRIIVNRALVRRFLARDHAVGESLLQGLFAPKRFERPIVGVAADTHDLGLDAPAEPIVYVCDYRASATLLIRTATSPAGLIEPVRRAVLSIDPEQPIYEAQPLDELFARSLARRRFLLVLFASFGLLALILAAAGIFAVVSRAVTERTREVGVRLALGASPGDVLVLIVRQQVWPVLIGLVIGTACAALLARTANVLLFGVGSYDALTYVLANALVFVAATAVTCAAAMRVLSVDPASAFRRA